MICRTSCTAPMLRRSSSTPTSISASSRQLPSRCSVLFPATLGGRLPTSIRSLPTATSHRCKSSAADPCTDRTGDRSQSGAWYIRRILPYRTQDNGVEGVVITFTDTTERRHTADELWVAKRQADLANVAKSRFLAAASHDLRQPLQTLALLQGLLAKIVEGGKPRIWSLESTRRWAP